MDRTATGRRATSGNTSKTLDVWFGLLDNRRRCVYCGHSYRQHHVEAQMAQRPMQVRRTRVGVSFFACTTCAADIGTRQVMCYQFAESLIKRGEESGLIFA